MQPVAGYINRMRFRHIAADLPLHACIALATLLLVGCGSKAATPTTSSAISVSLNLSTASLSGGGSQAFTATVANDSANAGVTWSIGAGVGVLSATTTTGVTYTAPAVITTGSTVTLTATSKTDTTKSASATITLNPISISLSATTASLAGSGSQAFTATVSNDSANAGVTWSIGTGAGALSSTTTTGTTYTAPALISAASTVTLTATSKTDTTKSASATITLNPISVSLSTTSVTLGGSGTQAFTATVANDSANAGVTWSIGTGAGALSSTTTTGTTYTAPATITATSTVTLTATSKTDTTKSASATITLSPISVSLSTTTVTLAASAAQAFTATVANDPSGAGVTWSIGSGPGTLSGTTTTAATFTAPHGLPATATVTLTATSKTDTTKHATATITLTAPTAPASQWVYYNTSGNLTYKALTNSDNSSGTDGYDQIMDFSTAGYMQGAVAIPTASVAITVVASGDTTGATDTTALQNAINTVSAMTLNTTTGLRGAVLMSAGNFYVNNTLNINSSGIVLRGSGSGGLPSGTVINMVAATTPYPLVLIAGTGSAVTSSSTAITDAYVPSGTLTLHVASTAALAVGTNVIVQRPVTSAWVSFMGMTAADLGTTCSGGACNWISVGNSGLKTERTITAISGNQITLDAPMSDSIDTTYTTGATVAPYTFTGRISQVGVENFSAIAPATIIPVGDPTYQLVMTSALINGWIRNLAAQDTLQSVDIDTESKQVTVNNVAITHTITQTGTAEFEEFYIASATQILMDTVSDSADNMYFFATSSETQGPNVLRNGLFVGDLTIEPHQRWATGLLVESTQVLKGLSTQGGVNFRNRGDYGTGHGWTIGWGVVWNTTGGTLVIQQPPGSNNWCIGCIGTQGTLTAPPGTGPVMPQGSIDSSGTNVFPASLYQAQLWQRLGQ